MKTSQLISSSVLSLLLGFGALAPRAVAQDLTDGPGKDVVVKVCTSCHDADNITSKKHTKEEWKGVIDTMIAYGAEVSDEQTEIITTYLAKNYGKANLTAGRVGVAQPRRKRLPDDSERLRGVCSVRAAQIR